MTFPCRFPSSHDFFAEALRLFERAGIAVPVVSGGGTPALVNVDKFPMLTEHRAGTYIYNDVMTVTAGSRDLGRLCDARPGDRGQPARPRRGRSSTAARRCSRRISTR